MDDVRFQARPALSSGLFEDPGFVPGAVASKAVGLEDDLDYRRAVWLYARANPSNTTVYLSPAQEALRASLEPKLIDASRAETDPSRRSRLLNLLGVVAMSRYAVDPGDRSDTVRAAIDSFTNAIKADPENADAKFNLEIVLRDFFHQVARPLPPTAAGWAAASPASAATARVTDGADVPHAAGGDLRRVGAAAARHLLVPRAARGPDPQTRSGWMSLRVARELRSSSPIAAVPLLLGIAAGQPVLGTERSVPERTDAEAFFVMDTSRSMLASEGRDGATRFDRSVEVASAIRDRIPQVRSGIVSMTDRLLPHVLPTTDRRVFETTLRRSIGVELPPPAFTYSTYATYYDILAGIPQRRYFSGLRRSACSWC